MLKISRQQTLQRWDTLPDNLKEALFSEYNANTLWRICEDQHLPEEKISQVATIAGDVLFGFLLSEDLAKEIKDTLNLNQGIVETIAADIDRKIFAPIRLDLEKVYAPPGPEEEILDLRKAEIPKVEPAAGIEMPKIVSLEEKPAFTEVAAAKKEETPITTPESSLEMSPSAIFGAAEPSNVHRDALLDEAEPPVVSEAEPIIIHKEVEFKPLSETKKSLGGLFGFFKKKEEKPESARVQVEIGDKSLKTEPSIPKITKTEPTKIRVVHYTEVPEIISPFPTEQIEQKPVEEKKEEEKIEIKPPENLPMVSEAEQTKPILDLRKTIEVNKPAAEKPITEPSGADKEEVIDLGMFK